MHSFFPGSIVLASTITWWNPRERGSRKIIQTPQRIHKKSEFLLSLSLYKFIAGIWFFPYHSPVVSRSITFATWAVKMSTVSVEELTNAVDMATISTLFQLSIQDQMANRRRHIGLIICKLHGDKEPPMELIIIATRNQWHCRGESMELDGKKFLFQFDSEFEKERILHKQPWVILGQTLILLEITERNFLQLPKFTSIPLWVTFSGLPVDYLSWEVM